MIIFLIYLDFLKLFKKNIFLFFSENYSFRNFSRYSRFTALKFCIEILKRGLEKTNCSRIIKFGILHLHHILMLLEIFNKDRIKTLCAEAHKRIIIHQGLWREFLVIEFLRSSTALNLMKLKYIFNIVKNM